MTSDAKASETQCNGAGSKSLSDATILHLQEQLAEANIRAAAADAEDAACFKHLQNIPVTEAQAYFWNYGSRTERRKAIKAAIAAREASHGQG